MAESEKAKLEHGIAVRTHEIVEKENEILVMKKRLKELKTKK